MKVERFVWKVPVSLHAQILPEMGGAQVASIASMAIARLLAMGMRIAMVSVIVMSSLAVQ
jgi:hypothetical protein